MHHCNFFVRGPNFTKFFSSNVGGIVVDQRLFRLSISSSVLEIFVIEMWSSAKSHQFCDGFCPPKF